MVVMILTPSRIAGSSLFYTFLSREGIGSRSENEVLRESNPPNVAGTAYEIGRDVATISYAKHRTGARMTVSGKIVGQDRLI